MRVFIVFLSICRLLFFSFSIYGEENLENTIQPKSKVGVVTQKENSAKKLFLDFINKKAYAEPLPKEKERKILRERWQEILGMDIFYPYFKAKEVENLVKEKTSITLLGFKGKAEFNDDSVKYIFKIKF
ncbi:MAG: hypothetical protein NC822_00320 [Candidatus Omnitrophica bacterium]|nr:hypothetical protein [Candidatus Omnitrophota bacterium]MCM8826939.1 hypothetical protein [Candidatus Omnitrophota bacterium]